MFYRFLCIDFFNGVSLRNFPINGNLTCLAEKKIDDSSRLDVVEIARVPDMLPSLFPSWSSLGLISIPVYINECSNFLLVIITNVYGAGLLVDQTNCKEQSPCRRLIFSPPGPSVFRILWNPSLLPCS